MEPDVSRSVAGPARLPLRPESSWVGHSCDREEICTVPRRSGWKTRFELPVRRNAGRGHRRAYVRWGRRHSKAEAGEGRVARSGLQSGERTLPLLADLQRRKLEAGSARAAHATGCGREGWRLLAGSERQGRATTNRRVQLL